MTIDTQPIYPLAVTAFSALAEAEDVDELSLVFSEFIKELGLDSFQVTELSDPDHFPGPNLYFGTLQDDYVKKYWRDGNNMFHDPVIRQLLASNKPYRFLHDEKTSTASKPTREILNRRLQQGISDGYAFALKGRLNRFAMVSVQGDVGAFSATDVLSLEMVCMCLYRRATDVFPLDPKLAFSLHGRLTDRERECLTWVAKGKTNWDISQILLITERTVQYHVENAREKLGADSRLQAVVIAARQLEIVL